MKINSASTLFFCYDMFHADGSSAGSAYQADGSYSDYVDDGLGNEAANDARYEVERGAA